MRRLFLLEHIATGRATPVRREDLRAACLLRAKSPEALARGVIRSFDPGMTPW
jgi:hypothetical protein